MTETNERVTVDFDSQSYYLDGEYWESWDNYGEEMADKINELLYNENLQWKEENKKLKELVSEVDNELEIRDTVCRSGKFRLEEWGKHRYHQFYKGDEELEDESIVMMLMEYEKENKELKRENDLLSDELEQAKAVINKKWSEYLKKKEVCK